MNEKGFTVFELILVLAAIVWVGFVIGLGFVAFHFIAKFW